MIAAHVVWDNDRNITRARQARVITRSPLNPISLNQSRRDWDCGFTTDFHGCVGSIEIIRRTRENLW
jgi:hypothetical protein